MAYADGLGSSLAQARRQTDDLFGIVRPEALFDRPVPERHRLNFYIGHLEAFDWNMACGHALGREPIRADLNELFAFGIDPDASDLPSDVPADWPSLAETGEYCRNVRDAVDASFEELPEDVARVCIEHRLMHAETLCYLLHNLDPSKKRAPAAAAATNGSKATAWPAREWVRIPAGRAVLGRARQTGFGWDNEFGEQARQVDPFGITKHKVTNGEYLEFVREGADPPHYWIQRPEGWALRTMFEEIPLPLDWPVYATHVQARSFAGWAGAGLPTEAQWDRAAYGSPDEADRAYPWGDGAPRPERGNFDFARWDPCAVTDAPQGDSAYGVSHLVGNGWEWTADLLRPLPGFSEYPFYPRYSSDFFDDEHYVLKGGSPRTARSLLRRSFRNWFREGYPYVYSTFRLVRD